MHFKIHSRRHIFFLNGLTTLRNKQYLQDVDKERQHLRATQGQSTMTAISICSGKRFTNRDKQIQIWNNPATDANEATAMPMWSWSTKPRISQRDHSFVVINLDILGSVQLNLIFIYEGVELYFSLLNSVFKASAIATFRIFLPTAVPELSETVRTLLP